MEEIDFPLKEDQIKINSHGTLAIDLGNSTTVVAFQKAEEENPELVDLKPISIMPGLIPSAVWKCSEIKPYKLIGNQVANSDEVNVYGKYLSKDFKRWIGSSENNSDVYKSLISPEKAGEILIKEIWERLPNKIKVKRLVLTAPVETYRSYREWLIEACSKLDVKEIALVDEPTAAAMGSGIPPGSKLLVVDIGGSTIDMSVVELEGGEGKAAPIAQLVRFNGKNLHGKSKQVLRCAKVLGKAGIRLGGRDIDRWIADYIYPSHKQTTSLLDSCEKLKCKLSNLDLKETKVIREVYQDEYEKEIRYLSLSRMKLEEIIIEKGLMKAIENLFQKAIKYAKSNSCNLEDLDNIVLVGGAAQMPIIKRFIMDICKTVPLLTPPPVEAIAIGALKLTPGVQIRDVLSKGISLRYWDKRQSKHLWHPLFLAGQSWPTTKPLEIILAASKENQSELDLMIGEPEDQESHEIVYINGLPTIKDMPEKIRVNALTKSNFSIKINPPAKVGNDLIKLKFSINQSSEIEVEGTDLRTNNEISKINLGSVR